MQCAPDSYELYQSIFGLRADAEIGPERSDFDTSLSEAEIEYAAGVEATGSDSPTPVCTSSDLSAPLICRERGLRGLFLILSRQKIFWYFMHMRGKTICEFTVKN